MKNIVIIILAAVVVGGAIYLATLMRSPQEGESVAAVPDAESAANASASTASVADQPSMEITYEDLLQLIGSLDQTQRDAVLADEQLFNEVVQKEALRRSFIMAANASQFANEARIKYLLERQADDFLVNSYITSRIQAAGVPEGFPGDEQIKRFYEQNQEQFRVGERLPVWQIFWLVAKDASEKDSARILKEASRVSTQLRKGSISFAEAAAKYSEHPASSLNGGFMGILQTADLRPDIKKSLLTLKEGGVSKPVRGENGIHIFMRGALLPEKELGLEQVKNKVAEALLQALRTQQRQQLQKLVQDQYPPVMLNEQNMVDWRQNAASFYKQSSQ